MTYITFKLGVFNENTVNTDPVTLNNIHLFSFLATGLTCYNCNDVDTVRGCSTTTKCNTDEVLTLYYILILFFRSISGTLVFLLSILNLFSFLIFLSWTYLMKVIPEARRMYTIRYLRFYYYKMYSILLWIKPVSFYLLLVKRHFKQW